MIIKRYRIVVDAERGVYVEVRGDVARAPAQVHHAEGGVGARRQRLQPHTLHHSRHTIIMGTVQITLVSIGQNIYNSKKIKQ